MEEARGHVTTNGNPNPHLNYKFFRNIDGRESHRCDDIPNAVDGGGPHPPPPNPIPSDYKDQRVNNEVSTAGDGPTVEVVRRPRGRPPGSKNKPKPPVVITREAGDSHDVMRPHVLEILARHDVGETLARFARRRNVGVSVLAGTGLVSNVTLRQPSSSSNNSAFTIQGRLQILSISVTFFTPTVELPAAVGGTLSVLLAGHHGQIVGGVVAGPLIAAGTVTLVAAVFSNPSFHRLPAEDDCSISGEGVDHEKSHSHGDKHHAGGGVPPGFPISTGHLLPDLIWPPMSRPSHPSHY